MVKNDICVGGPSKQNFLFLEDVITKMHPCPQYIEWALITCVNGAIFLVFLITKYSSDLLQKYFSISIFSHDQQISI